MTLSARGALASTHITTIIIVVVVTAAVLIIDGVHNFFYTSPHEGFQKFFMLYMKRGKNVWLGSHLYCNLGLSRESMQILKLLSASFSFVLMNSHYYSFYYHKRHSFCRYDYYYQNILRILKYPLFLVCFFPHFVKKE